MNCKVQSEAVGFEVMSPQVLLDRRRVTANKRTGVSEGQNRLAEQRVWLVQREEFSVEQIDCKNWRYKYKSIGMSLK